MRSGTTAALGDLLAALSIAGLLLPEAVAYSGLANLPPQAGVIALFAGLVSYGLIGRSRVAIVSATSSSAAVLASATLALAGGNVAARVALAPILVLGTGLAFTICGALRFGAIANLISRPVLRGYTFGLAVVIAVKQWPLLVGVHAHHSSFAGLLVELVRGFGLWHRPSLACGLAALAGLFVLQRVPRIPGVLVVIIAGIVAAPTLARHGVTLTGPIALARSLSPFPLPHAAAWLPLGEFSLALMFILYAESYTSIRIFALKRDDQVQPNRDLIALGIANIVSGLLHGTPVGAGYSGTSANDAAGARSRLAGLAAVAVLAVSVALFLGWIELTPVPVLAAIVIHAVSRSLRFSVFRNYLIWQRDVAIAFAAVLAVLVFGILDGLLAAIVFSLAMLIRSLAAPRLSVLGRFGAHDYLDVERYPDVITDPETLVLRPEEPLFFANAQPLLSLVRQRLLRQPSVRRVVLSLEESPDLDGTTLEVLGEFCSWLATRHIELRVARLKERARDALWRARLPLLPPTALDYSSVDDAVRGECVSPYTT